MPVQDIYDKNFKKLLFLIKEIFYHKKLYSIKILLFLL